MRTRWEGRHIASSSNRAVVGPPLAVALALIGFLFLAVGPASAAGTNAAGSVSGIVQNGTAGGGSVAGITVSLQRYVNGAFQDQTDVRADAAGRFTFTGVVIDPAAQYLPIAHYANVDYAGKPVALSGGTPTASDDVTVYETTAKDPDLRLQNANLILGAVDRAGQRLQFLEILTLVNPSDRTFVPSASGQGMPADLVRLALPADAADVTITDGLDPQKIIEVDGGIASTGPVLPGAQTVSFSFDVPYQGSTFSYAWRLVYPTGSVRLLSPDSGPVLSAPGMTAQPSFQESGHTFRVLASGAVTAGGMVTVDVGGLPARTWWQSLRAAFPTAGLPPMTALVAAALAALLPVLYLWRHPPVRQDAAALLDRLVALDEAHDRGEVGDADYAAQRAALKARLRAVPTTDLPADGI